MLDFTSALARLLRDGALRDRFASDPIEVLAEWGSLEEGDRAAILALDPKELEIQATILLRKRFEEVSRVWAQTCKNLGANAWPLFEKYARRYWPDHGSDVWADAAVFGDHLMQDRGAVLSPDERNRVAFATSSRRIYLCLVRRLPIGNRSRPGLQIFWRPKKQHWREAALSFGL